MNNDRFLIKGLAGAKTLKGTVKVSGAKNAALKAMAASLLFKDEVTLRNVPGIEDIKRIADLLSDLGLDVNTKGKNTYILTPTKEISYRLNPDISKRIRSSIVLTGPLLARLGKVAFPHPGGCVIGERPIDLFIEGYKKMGAKVRVVRDEYIIEAPDGKLVGTELYLRNTSVTATETFMMAGVLAKGTTVIKNAALEPEIVHLAEYLNTCGARITGMGTPTITIRGGALLRSQKKAYVTMPDRIEAGSFIILAALAGKDVRIEKCNIENIQSLLETLKLSGVNIETGRDWVRVRSTKGKKGVCKAVHIKTHEYPGFPTDLQAPMTVFLTQAEGESLVFETIFEGRLNYTESLVRMHADITMMDPHRILVKGPKQLHGKTLESPDLRAGLAFVIAAIIAKGGSVVHNVYNIYRGYENIEERLQSLGVDIQLVSGD